MTKRNRIEVIDWMRGIGALWVGLFHFTGGDTGWMAYAYPVLMTFFVASGLAIPYAMWPRYGGFSDAPVFMLRRLTRLEPPYFVAILLAVGLGYLSSLTPGFHGEPIQITPIQFLLHFGYLNDVFDQPWLNPVF
jgi:peptidoglycan/LPS O-acetylase OafA/YrhL